MAIVTIPPGQSDTASEILELVGNHERQIRKLFAKYGKRIAKIQNRITELEAKRDTLIAPHLMGLNAGADTLAKLYETGKIELPSGTLWSRHDWSLEIVGDEAEAIRAARRRGLKYITIKVTLNRRAILADRRRFARVPGFLFQNKHTLYIEPNNLGKTEPPKESRLTRVLGVVTAPVLPQRQRTKVSGGED